MRAPLSAAGSAAGSSAKRNACQREASSVRSSFELVGIDGRESVDGA